MSVRFAALVHLSRKILQENITESTISSGGAVFALNYTPDYTDDESVTAEFEHVAATVSGKSEKKRRKKKIGRTAYSFRRLRGV